MGKKWESVRKTGENFERKEKEMREKQDGCWMLRTTMNMHDAAACLGSRVNFGSSADR